MRKFKDYLKSFDPAEVIFTLLAEVDKKTWPKEFHNYYGIMEAVKAFENTNEKLVYRGIIPFGGNSYRIKAVRSIKNVEGSQMTLLPFIVGKEIANMYIPEYLEGKPVDVMKVCCNILHELKNVRINQKYKKGSVEVYAKIMMIDNHDMFLEEGFSSSKKEAYTLCWKELMDTLVLEDEDCEAINEHNPPKKKRCQLFYDNMKRAVMDTIDASENEGAEIMITDKERKESLPGVVVRIKSGEELPVRIFSEHKLAKMPIFVDIQREMTKKEVFLLLCMECEYPNRMAHQRELEREGVI